MFRNATVRMNFVTGCCMLVSHDTLRRVGLPVRAPMWDKGPRIAGEAIAFLRIRVHAARLPPGSRMTSAATA